MHVTFNFYNNFIKHEFIPHVHARSSWCFPVNFCILALCFFSFYWRWFQRMWTHTMNIVGDSFVNILHKQHNDVQSSVILSIEKDERNMACVWICFSLFLKVTVLYNTYNSCLHIQDCCWRHSDCDLLYLQNETSFKILKFIPWHWVTLTHLKSHAAKARWVCLRAENSAI